MKIWQLCFDVDHYDNLEQIKELTFEELMSFDGRPKAKDWTPLSVRRMDPEKGLALGDAPGFLFLY